MFFSSTAALVVALLIYRVRSLKLKELEQKLQAVKDREQSSRLLMQRLTALKQANEELRESLQSVSLLDLKARQLMEIQQTLGEMSQTPLTESFERQFAQELGGKKQPLQRSLPGATKRQGKSK